MIVVINGIRKTNFLILFFCIFQIFSASATCKYEVQKLTVKIGKDYAGAKYCGTNSEISIDEVYNTRLNDVSKSFKTKKIEGDLSKRISNLIWETVYDSGYKVGDIYLVQVNSADSYNVEILNLVIEITSFNEQCKWIGFSYWLM